MNIAVRGKIVDIDPAGEEVGRAAQFSDEFKKLWQSVTN